LSVYPLVKKTKEERDFQHLQHILHFFFVGYGIFVVAGKLKERFSKTFKFSNLAFPLCYAICG
jgi:hypothetical protein